MQRLVLTSILALAVSLGSPASSPAGDAWDATVEAVADLFQSPAAEERFEWSGPVAAGATLEIKGVNGSIKAVPAAGGDVLIEAEKRGRRNSPSEVTIQVVEHAGGITVCAVYPSSGSRTNECLPGDEGRIGARDNDVSVSFDVQVPQGVRLVAHTVNGSIKAHDLKGDVQAETVNGSVKLATSGRVEAETVNGSIKAWAGANHDQDAAFSTVNGSIALYLPDGLGAELDARTVNGSIRSDFELEDARRGRRRLQGTIGGGGPRLRLSTVNGSIRLKQS